VWTKLHKAATHCSVELKWRIAERERSSRDDHLCFCDALIIISILSKYVEMIRPVCYGAMQRWAQFVREVDPDIITGYNIQNFDLSYLLTRAKHLHVDDFCYLGRVKNIQSIVRSTTLQSKQLGKRENKTINIDGRVQFDLLLVSDRSYSVPELLCLSVVCVVDMLSFIWNT